MVEGGTPDQEFKDAALDNRSNDMGWWKWDLIIERLLKPTNGEGQRKLAAELGYAPPKVNRAWKITQALTPAARDLVTQSVTPRNTQSKGFLITESILLALADLGDPAQVEKALREVLDKEMTEAQVRELVKGLKPAGDPVASRADGPGVPPSGAVQATSKAKKTIKPEPKGTQGASALRSQADLSPGVLTQGESLLWDGLAGVSVVGRIKSKIKKGERPTWWEFLILAGATLLVPVKWIGHLAWKALKWVARELFHGTRQAARGLAKLVGGVVGGVLKMVLMVALVLLLVWGAYEVLFQHRSVGSLVKQVVMWPVETIKTAFNQHPLTRMTATKGTKKDKTDSGDGKEIENPQTISIEPPSSPRAPREAKRKENPVVQNVAKPTVQAWNAEIEDRSYLEAEIAAVPGPGWIISFPFEPIPMSGDMSIRRLGDLQDQEKYSLIVGHDKRKVLSVSPAMTGFTLTYEDGLPIGGILGGPAKIDFYWEDVKAIHSDEIDSGGRKIYQFSLVVNGLKKPFIVQCPTKEGLSHLVSAFEFWIGAAGAGRKAPVTGMPYLFQGLWVNNESKVTAIWADSPASQAGLRFGDVIWSLGADAGQLQKNQDLEAGLQSLTPGRHDLYVVTSADWGDRVPVKDIRNVRAFKVKRRKMEIVVP